MSQIVPVASPAAQVPALLDDDLATARAFIAAEKAAATRRAYVSDFRIFASYCEARGVPALPASPETVGAFLAAEAAGGAKASTIGRRVPRSGTRTRPPAWSRRPTARR